MLARQASWNVLEPFLKSAWLGTFLRDESGQDQIEYVLVITGLALGTVAVVPPLASKLLGCWALIVQAFNSAIGLP